MRTHLVATVCAAVFVAGAGHQQEKHDTGKLKRASFTVHGLVRPIPGNQRMCEMMAKSDARTAIATVIHGLDFMLHEDGHTKLSESHTSGTITTAGMEKLAARTIAVEGCSVYDLELRVMLDEKATAAMRKAHRDTVAFPFRVTWNPADGSPSFLVHQCIEAALEKHYAKAIKSGQPFTRHLFLGGDLELAPNTDRSRIEVSFTLLLPAD